MNKKIVKINYGFAVAFFTVELVAGLMNTASSRVLWCFLPYVFLFLPTGFFVSGAYHYSQVKEPIQKNDYAKSVGRLRNSVYGIIALSLLNVVVVVVFLILRKGTYSIGIEIAYILMNVLVLAIAFSYGKVYDKYLANIVACDSSNGFNQQ